MGMSAEVIAIGPFHPSLIEHLEYPSRFYEHTREGATIIEPVFATPDGSSTSRELAACFGVDPWAFGTHALHADAADIERLRRLFQPDEFLVENFLALRAAGFHFYFRPNG